MAGAATEPARDAAPGRSYQFGREWNAHLLKANFDRFANPDIKSPRAYVMGSFKDVQYPENYTCKIILKEPRGSGLKKG